MLACSNLVSIYTYDVKQRTLWIDLCFCDKLVNSKSYLSIQKLSEFILPVSTIITVVYWFQLRVICTHVIMWSITLNLVSYWKAINALSILGRLHCFHFTPLSYMTRYHTTCCGTTRIYELEGILQKWSNTPCLRMAERTLLAGYPRLLCNAIPLPLRERDCQLTSTADYWNKYIMKYTLVNCIMQCTVIIQFTPSLLVMYISIYQ